MRYLLLTIKHKQCFLKIVAMLTLNPDFWQNHFDEGHTPWDRGTANPQLLRWLDSNDLQPCRIAVPGCGNGWELVTLASQGFRVVGIDYTPAAVSKARQHLALNNVTAEVVEADVLTYQPHEPFDAVYEQTCLCAIPPDKWLQYASQLKKWVRPDGDLYVLFMQINRPGAKQGIVQGPPFHCDITAMHALFSSDAWIWPEHSPERIDHPSGWSELAVRLRRKT